MSRLLGRAVFRLVLALVALGALRISPVLGHEARPALLHVIERSGNRYDILWKQPSVGESAVRLVPDISGGLLEQPPTVVSTSADFQIRFWRNLHAEPAGLENRTIRIEGLEQTITDVLVTITRADGDSIQHILRPQAPSLTVDLRSQEIAVPAYFVLGIEHILVGADHLCFLLGLMLLVRARMVLIKTITAFTIGHSITLAAVTLGVIAVRPAVIEVLVALSIVFIAVELVDHHRGKAGLAVRNPYFIAFTFGLLHGSAFAGSLAEIGLPHDDIPLSLLFFNAGVELGQLIFIVGLLSVHWILTQFRKALPSLAYRAPPYVIGSLAAFWFFERLNAALR